MIRDEQIADLVLHGWTPYRDEAVEWWALWNGDERYGFATHTRFSITVHKTGVAPPESWLIEWNAIPIDILDALAEQVVCERTWAGTP